MLFDMICEVKRIAWPDKALPPVDQGSHWADNCMDNRYAPSL
ncbi:hypothetical protein AtDm6_2145 [Acetobacter tropicalis]|uniref:Uncharacterized protein n=1 Tax=Acetobacter tropicalis TaxID=104102 RepID=A0A094YPM4_9PROT|nr:hypothetical protein AtDm6_2145 [Acetobacter tropicalis]